MRRWKTSGALAIPNGNVLKQKRPYGVMKVLSSLDSLARGICQKPLLASSLIKYCCSCKLSQGGINFWVDLSLNMLIQRLHDYTNVNSSRRL